MRRAWVLTGVCGMVGAALVLSGCLGRGPSRVRPPSISGSAASQAMSKYDTDGDGKIAGPELDKAASLKSAMAQLDKNQDGAVSADEISARIDDWARSKAGLMSMSCVVTLDGRPVEGATVTLVPEDFLGPNVKQATGTTSASGAALLSVPPDPSDPGLTGVAPGFYRVEISKKAGGSETIPAKYNTETTLGCEVAIDAQWAQEGTIRFELTSR